VTVHTDVAVVGAGFAGLSAATELQRRGFDVVVVEARDRVGGKTESQLDALGRRIDTGGQFVNDDMSHVLALVRRQRKHLVPVEHDRAGRAHLGGHHDAIDSRLLWHTFERAERAYAGLWTLTDPLPSGVHTLAAWFDSLGLPDDVVHAARSIFSGVMCVPFDDLLLGHVVDLARRTPLTRDELQYVVAETMHDVAEVLAAELIHSVHLAAPVRAVSVGADAGPVVVVCSDDLQVQADHVVIAVPPTAYRTITFSPALPAPIASAAGAFRAGSVMKFVVRYERAFWQRSDVGSTSVWLEPKGLYVGEASIDDDAMLVVFLGGPATAAWRELSPAARRAAVLDRLVEAYGNPAAAPVSFVERDWPPDEWGGGGYWNVLVDPARLDAVEVLQRGVPRITFASTELAATFPGYVEGAISAGRAAAVRVAAERRNRASRSVPY
jgi:monoamine oxidase